MKKFLTALLIVGSLFFVSTAQAAIQTYTGTDDYTVGERETQEDAQNNSKLRALRNAQEQAGLYIRSRSRSKDLELVDDEIVTLTEGIVKIVGAPQYRKEILSDGKSILIHTTVTVQIDTDDVDRRLEEIARQHKPAPTTPIDRPKPIETPAPPVEEKPAPVDGETYMIKIDGKLVEPAQANGMDYLAEAVIRDGITYLPVIPIAKTVRLKIDWFPKQSSIKTKYGSAICYEKKGQLYCNADDATLLFNIEGGLQTNADGSKIFRFKSSKG